MGVWTLDRGFVWFGRLAAAWAFALAGASVAYGQGLPDVAFTKTGPATATPGSTISFVITATNNGTANSDPLAIGDFLPAGLSYESHVVSTTGAGFNCLFDSFDNSLFCSGGPLDPGEFHRVTLTVMVSASAEPGSTITNTAMLEQSEEEGGAPQAGAGTPIPEPIADPNLPKNAAHAVQIVGPDLTVQKTHPGNGIRGQQLTYTIAVSNAAAFPTAGTTTLTDTLPAGLTAVSFSGAGWTCTLVPLQCTHPAGVTGAFPALSLVVMVDAGAPALVTNVVSVATAGEANTNNNTASDPTTIAGVGLNLALGFSSPTYTAAGQPIEVRYIVTNATGATVTGIVVTDPKVAVITCPQTSLAPGGSMTCTGPYTTTSADVTAGVSPFTATVTGSGGATATATGAISLLIAITNDDFVRTRGQLLQVDPPGLHDRVGQVTGGLTESNGLPALNFFASVPLGASTAAEDLASGTVSLPYKVWIDGTLTLHSRDNGGGGFAQLGLGGDYLVNGDLLVGAALYIDWMTDNKTDRTTTGVGYLAGPYVSAEIVDSLTFDGAIFFGGSANDVAVTVGNNVFRGTFHTQRVVVQAQLDGLWNLDALTIRPDATMFLRQETVGAYTVRDAQGTVVNVSGFTNTSLNLSGGALIEKAIPLESGIVFIPQAGVRLGITGKGDALALDNPYGSASLGFMLEGEAWKYQSTVEWSLWASSLKAATWKGTLAGEF